MTDRPRVHHPVRLRRRLALAFALTAGIAALALAAGSYFLVRDARLDDSVERSLDQTRFNLVLAAETLTSGSPDDLLEAYERRGGFDTVLLVEDRSFPSSLSLGEEQVPEDLEEIVADGQLAYERTTVADAPYLVTGGQIPGTDDEAYFFFSEEEIWDDLAQLRNILLIGLGIVIVFAALAGLLLARRMLAPVARASTAARSLAEGLLDTRLPVEREDEFGAWAVSFNEMADALEAKINELSDAQARERRFTADVAHELRTPLTAVVNEASLLAEHIERMPPEAQRPAELLVADVSRLRDLVEDLMEISRLDAGTQPVRPEQVDLASLVTSAVSARGWRDRLELEAEEVVITSDPRRLERIVANLIGNALEHGGRDVSVRVGRDGIGPFVEVADRGPGIAREDLPHLFDRFFKADRSRAGRGTGLGLAIALENARLLDGEIDVWSETGVGTRFTLRLAVTKPLHDGESGVAGDEHD
ncbi:MAG TPA: HAMP domain-containing sensor histidine kinase [Gaiellaceae bacterium]|nr:HAMP domain-containing sensor histidine kinase [Gaiellaceae bacterium]